MASYYTDLEPFGNAGVWMSDVNGQNTADRPDCIDQDPCDVDGHSTQFSDPTTLLQPYDGKTTSWSIAPIATSSAYHHDGVSYFQVGATRQYPSCWGTQGDQPSGYFNTPHGPAPNITTWNTSQDSFPQSTMLSTFNYAAQASAPVERINTWNRPLASLQALADAPNLCSPASFSAMAADYADPSPYEDGLVPRRQDPRFAGDEYTAKWIRGEGFDRAGWCSRCNSW